MADMIATIDQFVQIKPASLPVGVSEVGVRVEYANGTFIGSFADPVGHFALATLLAGKPSGIYNLKGQYEFGGTYGPVAGVAATVELTAPPPPVPGDWEVVAA